MWRCPSFFTIAPLFVFLLPGPPAVARSETPPIDEREYLQLFYEEEELVEAATRFPKPISQIAENVTIITQEEIEAMNAQTVTEILHRAAGVFVDYLGHCATQDGILIHGSDYEHVLVLVDGIRWNSVASDINYTNQIPVRIIKRIEVIKGAASSTWGSALGGVVNIITKDAGKTPRPAGTVSGSFGEHRTQNYEAEAAGAAGPLDYYLFAGYRNSDGIINDQFFERKSFYGKTGLDLPGNMRLVVTLGYSNPQYRYARIVDWDLDAEVDERASFYTANLDMPLHDGLTLSLSGHVFENDFTNPGRYISTGEWAWKDTFDQETKGLRGRLVLNRGRNTAVLGAEYEDRRYTSIDELNNISNPTESEEIWAVFANDTMVLGRAALTPGLRYDHLSIASHIISPSLGITYRLNDTTLLRASVSRGFRKPTLGLKILNPELEKDKTWTYQAGLETTAARFAAIKTTFFYHDTDQWWDKVSWGWINSDPYRRKGVELEVRTVPFHHFSLTANGTYVRQEPGNREEDDLYNANVILAYDNPQILQARLMGHYDWWSADFSPDSWNGDYGTFIWDFVCNKQIFSRQHLEGMVFFTVRNLLNGNSYLTEIMPNAERWIEGGLRIHFQ